MRIALGVDTLSYHCRLENREISLEDVLREIADLGAAFTQFNAYHVRDRTDRSLESLRGLASELGLDITLSGDVLGRAGNGDTVEDGLRRLRDWIRLAETLGSPFVRVSSGFYRAELYAFPERIAAEQRYLIDTLRRAVEVLPGDTQILLENHSDFTGEEYSEIIQGVDSARVGVFLDLINPISSLQDPLTVVRQLAPLAPSGHVKDFRLVSQYVEDKFHRRGFDVRWCYPGEGVADLTSLVGVLTSARRPNGDVPYRLSVEGLDNYPGVADQRERLGASLQLLKNLINQEVRQ
ncbi:MAG: sugar phosphate isomerase/epimerase [Pseudonocardia sp.]|nr:sugar phosphate isomerase/epimerase [Pseudonocardia sp.]